MRSWAGTVGALVSGGLLLACGAAGPPPASPSSMPAQRQTGAEARSLRAPTAPPPAAMPGEPSKRLKSEAPSAADAAGAAAAPATVEAPSLEAAVRELELAAGDCSGACRALRSMERATAHLCSLTATAEHRRCEGARSRLLSARDDVRASCGSCPGGPSLERDAPIPSTR